MESEALVELNNFYIGESVNFMRKNISDNFIDLTVTSPPYDDLRKYNGFIFDYKSMFEELYRVTKQGGVVVWVVGDKTHNGSETGTSFKHALYAKDIGFRLHDTMIYEKNNPIPQNHNRYEQCFEYMFIFSKGKPNTFNPLKEETKNKGVAMEWGNRKTIMDTNQARRHRNSEIRITKAYKNRSNIFRYSIGGGRTGHPAVFPEQLAEDHIVTWSNKGDIVFDPMCGSGTTCKMAWLNKRNFIGIDISEEYINDICIPRLQECGWNKNQYINII